MFHRIRSAGFAAICLVIITFCSLANAAEFDESAVFNAIDKVVAEHKVYATCLSLDPTAYQIVQENWAREVKQGAEALKGFKPSAAFTARFVAAVHPSRLLDESMTLSAAMAYCQKNETQVRKFYEFGFSHLADAINKALKPSAK